MTVDADLLARVLSEPVGDVRIVSAALDAFLDFGIKRTSMGEIARRAKVSPATLYRKFPSKNAVVEAVALWEARRFIETVDRSIDKTASGLDQVIDCFAAFAGELTGNRLLSRLLVTEPDSVLPLLTIEAGPLLALGRLYLTGFVERLQKAGALAAFDAGEAAEIAARLALSLALTPDGLIPLHDPAAARRFAGTHIAALMRLDEHGNPFGSNATH